MAVALQTLRTAHVVVAVGAAPESGWSRSLRLQRIAGLSKVLGMSFMAPACTRCAVPITVLPLLPLPRRWIIRVAASDRRMWNSWRACDRQRVA